MLPKSFRTPENRSGRSQSLSGPPKTVPDVPKVFPDPRKPFRTLPKSFRSSENRSGCSQSRFRSPGNRSGRSRSRFGGSGSILEPSGDVWKLRKTFWASPRRPPPRSFVPQDDREGAGGEDQGLGTTLPGPRDVSAGATPRPDLTVSLHRWIQRNRQGRRASEATTLCGDVPRSPWPAKGIVQDLERLYRLRRTSGLRQDPPAGPARMAGPRRQWVRPLDLQAGMLSRAALARVRAVR